MPDKIRYCCGALYDTTLNLVVLIRKETPEFQKGYFNLVGGKLEAGETPLDAMVREFREEANLTITDWKQFCVFSGSDFEITYFYSTIDAEKFVDIKSLTQEQVVIWSISKGQHTLPLMANLDWAIPMSLNFARGKSDKVYRVGYDDGV